MTNNEFKRALQEIKTLKQWLEYWQKLALREYIERFGYEPKQLCDSVFIDMLQNGCANPNIKHITQTAKEQKEYVISEGILKP
jgi:hypothetical protein